MKRFLIFLFSVFLFGQTMLSQEIIRNDDTDQKYLEDQLYAGLGYSFILNSLDKLVQRNLSYHLHLGFIKDIPLNNKRNFGLGVGLGYGTNSYYTNTLAVESNQGVVYRLPNSEESFNRSKLETHALEFPFEIRWRTSNPIDYKFWRIYFGLKFEYLFSRRSILRADNLNLFDGKTTFSNPNIEPWQYGLTLSFGYNTWNLHLNLGLKELLNENAIFENEPLLLRPLRIGLIFYIL